MFQIFSVVLGLLLLGLDQWSKQWAILHLAGAGAVPVIPGLINFDFLPNGNDGAAWGMLSGRQTLLIIATGVMLLAILVYMAAKRGKLANMAFLSLALVASGGIGNLIDRVANHMVVDYLDVQFMTFAVFNFADVCVCTGVGLLVLSLILEEVHARGRAEHEDESHGDT